VSGPYGDAWEAYRRAGWNGVLPLPTRSKAHPPTGHTGEAGVWPSYADCHAWAEGPEGRGNIALRLPQHVLGVDVDNYDGKTGGQTVADAEERWGTLPPTWRTTSRDDGISGIRLYRIPEGLHWPGKLGDATELIQYRHRYAVAWPSVHPEGRTYRWITPEGVTSTAVPDPDALPLLPQAWVDGLTAGVEHTDTPRNSYATGQIQGWLLTRPGAADGPCARTRRAIDQAVDELRGTGSAHEAMTAAVMRAVRLADEGHAGLAVALSEIRGAFIADITRSARPGRTESLGAAEAEWRRAVDGAVNKVSATPSGIQTCDCDGQLTGLIVGGAYPVAGATALTPLEAPRQREPEPQTEPEPSGRERTSWWPRSLAAVLAGEEEEPPPAHLIREDGSRLLYDGKVNALLGESESGKTWVALLAVTQALAAGRRVAYLDFEDTLPGVAGRLRSLGTTPDQMLAHLDYIGPDETLHAAASDDLREHLDATQPALIVLDGVNAAMTLLGLDLEKNKDATSFAQLLLRPLTVGGACVVVVDHLPKNKENRGKGGIGAQAKRAMMTGCAITVDVLDPFGRGMTGRLKLTVDKDRPGHVRALCPDAKSLGTAILRSDSSTGSVTVSIEEADPISRADHDRGHSTMLMETICEHLATQPERTSLRAIRQAVKGGNPEIGTALESLIRHGYVSREGAGAGFAHTLIRPFTVAEDLSTPDRARTVPNRAPGTVATSRKETVPTVPPPVGGARGTAPEAGGSGAASNLKPSGHGSDPEIVKIDGRVINTRTGEILEDAGGSP
jgi:hypothetical protein